MARDGEEETSGSDKLTPLVQRSNGGRQLGGLLAASVVQCNELLLRGFVRQTWDEPAGSESERLCAISLSPLAN